MTRAGEKLHGDWERRLRDAAHPIRWGRLRLNAALLLTAMFMLGAALFGFG